MQTAADTAIETINETADNAVENINKTATDAVESIGKAEESINESVTAARESAEAAANSANQAATSASAAQTSERNASNSATQASQSATAAKQSETNAAESARNAASSAEQAANVVASVSGSVAQAENAAQSASQSATDAAGSASAAGGSAQAAADSASKAGESATAAGLSERNAASSAAQAAQSATAAAQSASEAQNAVDGFGLEVGTTTTGEPGTDAAVEIRKTGTKYTANFTIPRGNVGPAGVNENVPLGSTSGVVAQATDAYPALPRKVHVHGLTVDVHTVEPTKLIIAGENPIDLSKFPSDHYNVSGDTVTVTSTDHRDWLEMPYIALIPPGNWEIIKYGDANVEAGIVDVGKTYLRVRTELKPSYFYSSIVFTEVKVKAFISDENDFKLQIKKKDGPSDYIIPYFEELNLPLDISLADGDTLAIDRDGTTKILHADGEPTVLENVTLPELPAPMFSVYTTGGNVQPTVDVGYERDINIVINKLEQAMAAQAATMKVNQLTD